MPGVAVVTGAGRGFGREIARRLAGRGYTVLATDVDAEAAASTAEEVGGFSMQLDVRDPDAHRAAARAALERGPLEVWVNNAGVLRTVKAWEHSDDEVRLLCDVNLAGVIWGSRAAVDAMRSGRGQNRHIINLASMSALGPVPGLAVYAATKHAVLGFTGSLQGDLDLDGIPITMHAVCPDGADTELLRERAHEADSAIIWSGPRLLTPEEVADQAVALLDSKKLVLVIPRWRGWGARVTAMLGRAGLKSSAQLRRQGERHRAKTTTQRTRRPWSQLGTDTLDGDLPIDEGCGFASPSSHSPSASRPRRPSRRRRSTITPTTRPRTAARSRPQARWRSWTGSRRTRADRSGESCAASAGARTAPRCTRRAARSTGTSTPPARPTAARRAG